MQRANPKILTVLLLVAGIVLAGCQDSLMAPATNSSPSSTKTTTASNGSSCDATVLSGGTIQTAIDNASDGDVVCVEAGTYNEDVNVDKDITLQGTTTPEGPNPAVLDGQLAVNGEGATVMHLKVAPTTTFDVDAGGIDPFGIRVTASNVSIEGNAIYSVTGDATGGNSSGTVHGIQVWNGSEPYVTGVTVHKNTILDIENLGDAAAGWPQYGGAVGIKIQGVLKDIEVTNNTVRGVHSAGWVYGVSLTHTGNDPQTRSPENVAVERNTLEELNDGSVYAVFDDPTSAPYPGAAVAIDDTENPTGPGGADADQATVQFNNFLSAPIGTQNKDQVHTLVAECNYWGHASGPSNAMNNADKGADAVGDVDYRPWSVREFGKGKNPQNSCVGGQNRGNGNGPGNSGPGQ